MPICANNYFFLTCYNAGVCQSEISGAHPAYSAGKADHDLVYRDGIVLQEMTG